MAPTTATIEGLNMGLFSSAAISGTTPQAKLHSACRAFEGLFAGELLKEIGDSGDNSSDPTAGQYSDFVQQALSQSVTSGRGLGLASMLEKALTPPQAHSTPATSNHANLHAD